ncbi:hypothetical protein BLOT_013176 [Blomia tropicalis]|nr:hypothetical protein BLOT_013176 [Blomia tropicalis]
MVGFDLIYSSGYIALGAPILLSIICMIRQRLLSFRIKKLFVTNQNLSIPKRIEQSVLSRLRVEFIEMKLKQLLLDDLLRRVTKQNHDTLEFVEMNEISPSTA